MVTESPLGRDAAALPNLPEYTVSEISAAVKRSLEQGFAYVRVRGEISGFKRHSSGHCYLTLKDAEAALDGVMCQASIMPCRKLIACLCSMTTPLGCPVDPDV